MCVTRAMFTVYKVDCFINQTFACLLSAHLRIDNRRQSVIRATLHYSVTTSYTVFYHIPNDSSYFCLSDQIKDIMITPFFQEIENLKLIFQLLFFEHGYLAYYLFPKNTILPSCLLDSLLGKSVSKF